MKLRRTIKTQDEQNESDKANDREQSNTDGRPSGRGEFLLLYVVLCVVVVVTAIVIDGLQKLDNEVIRTLIPTLVLAPLAILGSSSAATFIHWRFSNIGDRPSHRMPDFGREFQRYTTRFSWLVVPIAVGYAVARVSDILLN